MHRGSRAAVDRRPAAGPVAPRQRCVEDRHEQRLHWMRPVRRRRDEWRDSGSGRDPISHGGELRYPTLTLHRKNGPSLEFRFQHPDCEGRKVGLCSIAYDPLASADAADSDFLQQLSIDLRDVLETVKNELFSKPPS